MSAQPHRDLLLTADDAWVQAHKAAVTAQPWEQVEYLLETIGSRFTAAGVGVADARTVRGWRDQQATPRDYRETERLRLLYRLVWAITGVYGNPAVATAFLRSANPQLDDEAPLVVIASGHPEEVQKSVLAAARAFLEG